jgi:hypothetical protein
LFIVVKEFDKVSSSIEDFSREFNFDFISNNCDVSISDVTEGSGDVVGLFDTNDLTGEEETGDIGVDGVFLFLGDFVGVKTIGVFDGEAEVGVIAILTRPCEQQLKSDAS